MKAWLVTRFWNRGFLVSYREMAPTAPSHLSFDRGWGIHFSGDSLTCWQVSPIVGRKCQSLTIWTSPWGGLRVFLACSQHPRDRNPRMHSGNNGACYDPALKITDLHIHPFNPCMDIGAKDHQRLVPKKNQIGRVAWKHMHYHMQNRCLVGICCVAQGAQSSALWQPRWVLWRGRGVGRFRKEGKHVYLWLIHFDV